MKNHHRESETSSNIWMITREYDTLAGAGGIKDVVRQLSEALVRSGHRVSVVLPLYGFMDPEALGFTPTKLYFEVEMNYLRVERLESVRVFSRHLALPPARSKDYESRPAANKLGKSGEPDKSDKGGGCLTLYLLDAQRYRDKQGVYAYTAAEEAANPDHHRGDGHFDYFAMNVLLQKASLALMIRLNQRPAVIHCHDGHTALIPALIRELEGFRHYFAGSAAVVTVHNAGLGYHQEVGDLPFAEAITGLPARVIHHNLLAGNFDPLLAASAYAPLNTVSENYARELRESDNDLLTGWLGHRLLERGVSLTGITNGINPKDFNPEEPAKFGLPAAFSPGKGDLAGKAICRAKLLKALAEDPWPHLRRFGSLTAEPSNLPLFTFVGRLSAQKGVDQLLEALGALIPLDPGFQVLILGSGDKDYEQALARLAQNEANRGRVCFLQGYDPQVAIHFFAAGDFLLIPSTYEPCGLTDYMAQLFGSLPIVHHVGGLVKVLDGQTGLAYHEPQSAALMGAIQRALALFRQEPEKLLEMRRAAVLHIQNHYTWERVTRSYLELYDKAGSGLEGKLKTVRCD